MMDFLKVLGLTINPEFRDGPRKGIAGCNCKIGGQKDQGIQEAIHEHVLAVTSMGNDVSYQIMATTL